MKKTNRILKGAEISKVIKEGKSFRLNAISLHVLPNNENKVRVAISIQTKLGSAVRRNKAKRQINSIISPYLDVTDSKDYVFIVYKEYDINTFKDNEQVIKSLIDKGKKIS